MSPENMRTSLVEWLRDWFKKNGDGCNAVIGISGGCDSAVVAALCAEAIGRENVVGVMMPNVIQPDIKDSRRVIDSLGIRHYMVPITLPVMDIVKQLDYSGVDIGEQAIENLPPRIRMATLYALSQSINGRVVNTSNFSERAIGWGTRWGDMVGDVSPIAMLTKTEVVAIGHTIDYLPNDIVDKPPSGGLTGSLRDEDALGFSYEVLDGYLINGDCPDKDVLEKILQLRGRNRFKLHHPQMFHVYGSARS